MRIHEASGPHAIACFRCSRWEGGARSSFVSAGSAGPWIHLGLHLSRHDLKVLAEAVTK